MTDKDQGGRLLRERVAEEVRALLARKMMTGADLAAAIGKSPMYVSRRVRGEVAFDLDDMERMAVALGVSVTDLMPRQVVANADPNRVSGQVSRLAAPAPAARQARAAHRPTGRTSPADRRPRPVRSPGHTMPATRAA